MTLFKYLSFPWLFLGAWTYAAAGTATQTKAPVAPAQPPHFIENETAMCRQCHPQAVATWQQTAHKKTYDELHLRNMARKILNNLGETGSIRRNAMCVQCHYTQSAPNANGHARSFSGVSCQQCHGAASDWLDVHQDTAEIPNREERLAKAMTLGMRPSTDIYTLASQCYRCHTVPKETLVNQGHHTAGSDFELVEWMSGEMRHNFLDETISPRREQAVNHERDTRTKRLYYVVGKVLEMEYTLRGLAEATEDGNYLDATAKRAQAAYEALKGIGGMKQILEQVPAIDGQVTIAANNRQEYLVAADGIREIARTIEANPGEFATALSTTVADPAQKYATRAQN